MKSRKASASAAKNDEVPPPELIHASSKRRRTSSRRIDIVSNPAFTARRAHHERCTATVNRNPALCGNVSRQARSAGPRPSERKGSLPSVDRTNRPSAAWNSSSGISAFPAPVPNCTGPHQFLGNPLGTKAGREFFQHLENHAGHVGSAGQHVLQQLPHALRHSGVVPIHPKAVPRRSAGDVYFNDPGQPHPVDDCKWVESVIQRIAINIVKIEQLVTTAPRHDGADQPHVVTTIAIDPTTPPPDLAHAPPHD